MSPLQQLILSWFPELPVLMTGLIAVVVGLISLVAVYWFASRLLLPSLKKVALFISPKTLAPLTHLIHKLDRRLAIFICSMLFINSFQFIYPSTELFDTVFKSCGQIVLVVYGGLIFSSIVSIAGAIYNQLPFSKDVPIQGLIQVVKLIIFIIVCILVFSILIHKSPTYILSGFGALAAVLVLVFKDTILGFVASIQIAANRLVTYGDWIQMDKYGADGEIEELGLNTVKVRNWDKTITTIPTYALTSDSFKNWRGMQDSTGRRIKRAINIDLHSVQPINEKLQQGLIQHPHLQDYIQAYQPAVLGQSNITLFRQYAEFYLTQHPALNQQLTLMVRALQPTAYGLPIEFYCFSKDKSWIPYEHLQADLIDHFIMMLPVFNLKPYQLNTAELTN